MVEKSLNIIWTNTAKRSLKNIYEFYYPKSKTAAQKKINEILEKIKTIKYSEQYQVDEVDIRYRRLIVRHFKVLYSRNNETIKIHRVFDCRQNPDKLKESKDL